MAGSCDSRCTSGQEGSCVCSCGGANHGTAKKIYDILKDGGNADVKGAGLDLHLAEREDGKIQVWNRGNEVQVYKSEKEFVKDLGKLIVAGQVDVNATDAYNHRQVDLKGVQGRDPEAGKARLEAMREPTVSEAFDQIRAAGAKVTRKDGEFKVNIPGGNEDTAYYTDDPKDAIGTAKAMMDQFKKNLEDPTKGELLGKMEYGRQLRKHSEDHFSIHGPASATDPISTAEGSVNFEGEGLGRLEVSKTPGEYKYRADVYRTDGSYGGFALSKKKPTIQGIPYDKYQKR